MKKMMWPGTLTMITVMSLNLPLPCLAQSINVNELKEILKNNPEIILEVLQNNSEAVLDIAQQGSNIRRKNNLENQWKEDVKTKKQIKLENRPVLGNKNAKIKIVVFSDFTCHFCQQASKSLAKILEENPDIGMVFKHIPLDEAGPGGLASRYFIAIAKEDEGKAWEFYDKMYGNREKLIGGGEGYIREVLGELGLDYGKMSREIKGGKVKEVMREDGEEGERLGIEGTPYILINDLVIRGAVPYELLREGVRVARETYK